MLNIIGLCGSLRKDSYNRKLLLTIQSLLSNKVQFEIVEIGDLPLFNQDIELNPPETVIAFRKKVGSADGILFATPEYNYSVSAVLKNAIEWGSRPYGKAVLNSKSAAVIGASTGMLGTSRAQYHLRQICVQVNIYMMNGPEVMVPFEAKKFDETGKLIDEATMEKLQKFTTAFMAWVEKMKP